MDDSLLKKIYKHTPFALCAVYILALLTVYGHWLFTQAEGSLIGDIMSAAVACMAGFLGIFAIRAVFASWEGAPDTDISLQLGKRSLRPGFRHPILRIAAAVLLSRVIVYFAAYALYCIQNGYTGALPDTLTLWLKGDAPHYLGIADNWYVAEGDPRFHIVFFPLYPIFVRAFKLLGGNTLISGVLVSLICTVGAGILLYELALLDYDRASAKRAVKYQLLLPAAFLFNAPMSDALFLLLTLACMLLTRKKRYVLACIIGGMAAFTRVLGILLIVPVFIELIGELIRMMKKPNTNAVMAMAPGILSLLFIPMGLLLHLLINRQVTGDAFTFLYYQSSHWNQRLGYFFSTAAYQTDNFLSGVNSNPPTAFGLWLPNIIHLACVPALMLIVFRKQGQGDKGVIPMRASYQAYFLAYYIISMGATWLLSAPRYLTACFPVSLALVSLTKNRVLISAIYCALLLGQLLYMSAYVAGWPVY